MGGAMIDAGIDLLHAGAFARWLGHNCIGSAVLGCRLGCANRGTRVLDKVCLSPVRQELPRRGRKRVVLVVQGGGLPLHNRKSIARDHEFPGIFTAQ